ncbi:MAG: Ca2+-binding RTX toxin-like protein [Candidatus Nitrosomirales archaeon]|jgi:Ca2+-binding RTX toxin-like protein
MFINNVYQTAIMMTNEIKKAVILVTTLLIISGPAVSSGATGQEIAKSIQEFSNAAFLWSSDGFIQPAYGQASGSIIIEKVTKPSPDPQDFSFNGTSPIGIFALDDDNDPTLPKQITFILAPGKYNLTEQTIPAFNLTSIVCNDPDSGTTVNLATAKASIDLDAGETVKCTYTNDKNGKIIIEKNTVPNDAQDFNFTRSFGASFLLDDDPSNGTLSNSTTFTNVPVGNHTVTEKLSQVPAYNLTSIVCTDPDNGTKVNATTATATIDLDSGETVTCTYTNIRNGKIIIEKNTVPNDAQDFNFTRSFGASFLLDDDGADSNPISNDTSFTLPPGSYKVIEQIAQAPAYNLTKIVCIDPDSGTTVNLATATATIDLDSGETVTCTYTNIRNGKIIIEKNTVPNDAQDFNFTRSFGASFLLDDDGADSNPISNDTSFTLPPGSYKVIEQIAQAPAYNLTKIVCIDPDSGTTVNLATATATIDLDSGETVTCTYTNNKLGHGTIIIEKNTVPNDAQDFNFTRSFGASFLLDDDPSNGTLQNTTTFSNVPVGNHTVTEQIAQAPAFSLTKIVCTDVDHGIVVNFATATANIDLDPGEIVKCTFTDTKQGFGGELFCGKTIDKFAKVIDGTTGDDTLSGTNGDDLIRGFGGNDNIKGKGGNDCLIGGEGNDTIKGGKGSDTIQGDAGNDTLTGNAGNDVINGGTGNDTIKANAGNDTIDGGDGTDACNGGPGTNTITNCESTVATTAEEELTAAQEE